MGNYFNGDNVDPENIVVGGIYAVMTDEGLSKVAVLNRFETAGDTAVPRIHFEIQVMEGVLQSRTILPPECFDLWRIGYQNTVDREAGEWIEEICRDLGIRVRVRVGNKFPIQMTIRAFLDLVELIPDA